MRGRGVASATPSRFPLSSAGRYLVGADGRPVFLLGDTPWSIAVQLTHAQVDQYLEARAAQGFTAILWNAIEHKFSSQTPAYRNAYGYDPFTTMTDFAAPNENYWRTVDYIVNRSRALGIVCVINPAYLGYGGGDEGFNVEVTAESAADLQTYGAWLARRYTQGNVIWCMGGDYAGTVGERDKQWHVVTGMRTVRTSDLITAHNARTDSDAFSHWSGYAGFNLNAIYVGISVPQESYSEAATAYGRSGPLPFVFIEGDYDSSNPATDADLRRQAWQSVLSGACGHFFGNVPIWGFGEPVMSGGAGAAAALASGLDTTATRDVRRVHELLRGYEWHLLEPRTDTSLVTSSLGTGTARVCPALAKGGRFALIWVPSDQSVTVQMSAFTVSSVRARLYDPTTGAFSAVAGSPFANSGTQSITTGGERVIVLDPA